MARPPRPAGDKPASRLVERALKPAVFVAALLPLALLLWRFRQDDLGANPLSTITNSTGEWTLRFLCITLAVTPLRRLTGWNQLQRVRRMLGLFAFFYACLHLTTYLWLDKFFAWREILPDVVKRKFITAGFTGWLLMLPLAATSFGAAVRWLGGKRWQKLHRLAYAAAAAGVVHYFWLVKADHRLPLTYGAVLAALLALRLPPVAARLPRLRARFRGPPAPTGVEDTA
ncbi:MAG TPA: protein-methionine-sulfoxide reductase heme-binding subunit MsrQ [Myxococcota bacterium]|jgi:sulfoxide reductase heme-binding subunit YedZ|nr:protein-methionine-sulfoxide reductase heme-binding subunit MsrQ [Myxococcota bacterium]